ncbi:hypothetical protein RRG08_057194 [Elysia crispata]|uniref:Uncharacterized protein n=1 Tax=Elysia crispata TaxID=231223 RepID=A0AAE1CNB9_9GAST|nr:hypothetical protein RRG08_057194 [Elysia crispata]
MKQHCIDGAGRPCTSSPCSWREQEPSSLASSSMEHKDQEKAMSNNVIKWTEAEAAFRKRGFPRAIKGAGCAIVFLLDCRFFHYLETAVQEI